MEHKFAESLPETWIVRRLDEIACIVDSLHRTPTYSKTGCAMVRVTDVQGGFLDLTKTLRVTNDVFLEFTQRYTPKQGDIVFSRVGSYGNASYAKTSTPFCLGQNTALISPHINGRFLHMFLQSAEARRQIEQLVVGSTQRTISLKSISGLQIPIPPPKELEAIAAVLGALDDKIELNRQMNATLEAMARALFQTWFVDFDPVRAKLDGHKPMSMDAATAALFPGHLEDSPLGHIPKGWEACSLASKIELLSGGTPKTSEPDYWSGDIPWYSVKDAPSETDVWVIQTEKQVTNLGVENSAAQILPEGTTIISARGTVGKLALVGTPMAMNQSCYGVRGVNGYADYFTYFVLRQATADLQQRTHGTVFDTITRQTFETLDCIFPPATLSQAFDRTVAPLLAQVRANLHQSRILATLRDTLLPKLLSGELSVACTEN